MKGMDSMTNRTYRRTLLIGLVLATSASATAHAVTLPSNRPIPAPPGIQFFGYYTPADDLTDTHPDHANVAMVFGEIGMGQQDATMLQNLRNSQTGAILDISNVFVHPQNPAIFQSPWQWNGITNNQIDGTKVGSTDPTSQAWAASLWQIFQSNMEATLGAGYFSGTNVVAFKLGDEPNTADANTVTMMGTIATFLKSRFPNIPRLAEFTAIEIDTNSTFRIPNDITWVGFDCYNPASAPFLNCASDYNGYHYGSIAYYTARLKTLIRNSSPDGSYQPRLVSFPVAMLEPGSTAPLADQQAALLERVEREVALAESDPAFVMFFPFRGDLVGQAPTVLNYYTALGLHVANGTDRLAYPTSATGYAVGTGPEFAFDYDPNTAWNSEESVSSNPSLWAAFADPIRLTEMSVVIDQSPSGAASHMVSGVDFNGTWNNIWFPASNNFVDFQALSKTFSSTLPGFAQIVTSTQQDPGWVAWRSQEFRTTGTTRLYAYPFWATGSVTPMEYVCDGSRSTAWNSGMGTGAGSVRIDMDLGSVQTLGEIQLVTDQSPSGATVHTIYGGPDMAHLVELYTFSGNTVDNQTLTVSGSFPNVRYLRVQTFVSPSWVAWREISVFKQ
jgi:hypothetical protein